MENTSFSGFTPYSQAPAGQANTMPAPQEQQPGHGPSSPGFTPYSQTPSGQSSTQDQHPGHGPTLSGLTPYSQTLSGQTSTKDQQPGHGPTIAGFTPYSQTPSDQTNTQGQQHFGYGPAFAGFTPYSHVPSYQASTTSAPQNQQPVHGPTFPGFTPYSHIPSGQASTISAPQGQQPVQATSLEDQIQTCLNEPFPEDNSPARYNMYVHDENDFRVKMNAYLSLQNQQQAAQYDDFPQDAESQRDLVQQLVLAMTNVADAEDRNAKMPLGRIRKLSPFEFNLMGWGVLLEIRDVQQGQIALPGWGKDWEVEECVSFRQRFELVRSALHSHKTIVASLFDHVFVKRLVINPSMELDRKNSNKVLNAKRKKDLDLARQVKIAEQEAAESNG